MKSSGFSISLRRILLRAFLVADLCVYSTRVKVEVYSFAVMVAWNVLLTDTNLVLKEVESVA